MAKDHLEESLQPDKEWAGLVETLFRYCMHDMYTYLSFPGCLKGYVRHDIQVMQDVAADFQQRLDDVDIGDLLDRPPCMDDETAVFVDPLTQCPQKPRGRKKGNGKKKANEPQPEPAAASKTSTRKPRGTKREAAEPGEQIEKPKNKRARGKSNNAEASAVGTGRPSAAACGFSTAGLTDAEVMERIFCHCNVTSTQRCTHGFQEKS